ncbi:MAG: site-specific DNA-methyltransferase [Propionibacteriaceae bacterium]|jgi:tRNA G10  N-methylase Trm11|nr:site-specific DNA-methyltransferase [Propionibacteriaceae bacterium]
MREYLLLLAPAANRVYAAATPTLAAAELALTSSFEDANPTEIAGVNYVSFQSPALTPEQLALIAKQSAALALFERVGADLRPTPLPYSFAMDEDLVTIPKYHGKTNEQFTQLLLNVTLAACATGSPRPEVLDPLAGRGTTLTTAWRYGLNAYGVEVDVKAFEALAAYLKTYLRSKRYKHAADITPVRRDGKMLGRRFDAALKDDPGLQLTVFSGDTRDAASLYGKRRFDCIVTDAPYGVSHGAYDAGNYDTPTARPARSTQPLTADKTHSQTQIHTRSRSPEALLSEAIPVWASQLKPGGALGVAYNTFTLPRERLLHICDTAGLKPQVGGAWEQLIHRVDQAIRRDIVVAVKDR